MEIEPGFLWSMGATMSTDANSDRQHLGKYELRERLGRGGMAEVWKAYDPQLQRYVAIKILHADLQTDPEFMSRFAREGRLIASLHHPNIVQIYDFQTSDSPESHHPIAYMVMDYVEGPTLAEYLRNTSRLGKYPPPADLVQLFASISRAVDYAHQQGMIHRDIKPGNILLDKRHTTQNVMGEPVLTDFGIAKLMGPGSNTLSGTWLGTPLYISPEQAQGHPGNERSDIYSLGVILYEVCTGVPPFRGETITAIMAQHIKTMPVPPTLINPNIPPGVAMVILRCLAKDPAGRFSSASAMTASLAEAFNVPIPSDMSQPLPPLDVMNDPTYLVPLEPTLLPAPGSGQFSQPVPLASSQVMASVGSGPGNPTTPVLATPGGSSLASAGQHPQVLTPTQTPPSMIPAVGRQRRGLRIALLAAVILVLLASVLGGLYWYTHSSRGAVTGQSQVVGHVFFVSSGQVDEHSNQGINDRLLIDLQNISGPAPGKSHYAWLLGDRAQTLAAPILLGKVPVTNGGVHFLYPGDIHHTNLLALTSRFLITEEDANTTPSVPSPDQSTWRYFVELPQTPDTMDMMHEGALQHLRHLLANAPELMSVGLPGGLDIWLFRNTEKVFEWSGSARDFWERQDVVGIRNQVIRILDYLDGKTYVNQDVPAGTPNLVNPRIAPVALLEFDQQKQQPPGLLYLIGIHLGALVQAPGLRSENHALAAAIDQEINNVLSWLQQVRVDAKQLMGMTDAQLLSQRALSTLDDMETTARYAFIGQVNPDTNRLQGAVVQIHYNIQGLATLDVTPFKP